MTATVKCKKAKKRETPELVDAEDKIPQEVLADFVGNVRNLFKINCMRVSPQDKYRIDVWVLKDGENEFVKSFSIAKSFYVHYNKEVGITDETYSHKKKG